MNDMVTRFKWTNLCQKKKKSFHAEVLISWILNSAMKNNYTVKKKNVTRLIARMTGHTLNIKQFY